MILKIAQFVAVFKKLVQNAMIPDSHLYQWTNNGYQISFEVEMKSCQYDL